MASIGGTEINFYFPHERIELFFELVRRHRTDFMCPFVSWILQDKEKVFESKKKEIFHIGNGSKKSFIFGWEFFNKLSISVGICTKKLMKIDCLSWKVLMAWSVLLEELRMNL